MMTSEAGRRLLLRIARHAIVAHVDGASPNHARLTRLTDADDSARQAAGHELDDVATRPGAAFVTIHCRGQLRGCIGHLESSEPLGRVIEDCAVSACSADPRFAAVTAAELADLEIELSLLGPLERVTNPVEIEIGRDGLVIELGGRRGLLLPQVATEWQWDRETFLAQTCHKAGLPRDAWRHGAVIWRFEAEVFGEKLEGS